MLEALATMPQGSTLGTLPNLSPLGTAQVESPARLRYAGGPYYDARPASDARPALPYVPDTGERLARRKPK